MSGLASWSTPFITVPLYRLRILYADSAPATSYRGAATYLFMGLWVSPISADRSTIEAVKRFFLVAPVLLLLSMALGGCSISATMPSTTLVAATPTPAPTPLPTAAPANPASATGFDTHAGNCLDAANQAIVLVQKTANGDFAGNAFTTDMRLDLEPHDAHTGCAAAGQALHNYQQYVNGAQLQVWTLDNNWSYASQTTRQNWLQGVLHYLLGIYPRADIGVKVYTTNGGLCGTAAVGAGQGGSPSINVSSCG